MATEISSAESSGFTSEEVGFQRGRPSSFHPHRSISTIDNHLIHEQVIETDKTHQPSHYIYNTATMVKAGT
jgi:hypothetical protein